MPMEGIMEGVLSEIEIEDCIPRWGYYMNER